MSEENKITTPPAEDTQKTVVPASTKTETAGVAAGAAAAGPGASETATGGASSPDAGAAKPAVAEKKSKKEEPYTNRVFKYEDKTFPDPGKDFSEDDVLEVMASIYPDLSNAAVTSKVLNGVKEITFTKTAGRKG